MELEDKLKIFDYNQQWLDSGILDIETLNAQVEDYKETKHSCFEHYRCGTFSKWLFNTKQATTEELEVYIKLALSDSDQSMGLSAIIDLIKVSWLSDEQFENIAKMDTIKDKITEELYKTFIIRELSKDSLSNEIFEKAMLLNNSSVQRKLLEHKDLSKVQVEELAENGTGKKIRNIASQLLNSKLYQ